MEPEDKHTIYRLGRHGKREKDIEAAGIQRWDPNLAGGVENAEALEDIIGDGITDAEHHNADIDLSTARTIARAIANALGDAPALDKFAATGEGDRLRLEQEYLELNDNPTTPAIVRHWIDWLASFLFWRAHPEHPRPLAYPAQAGELPAVLVRDQIAIAGGAIELYRPASQTDDDRATMICAIEDLIAAKGHAAQAFLSLADIDASSLDLEAKFNDVYIGDYDDIDDVIAGLTDFHDWEVELEVWAERRGLGGMVALDRDEIEKMTRETWDIVELEGRCYVFNQ
jgi:hypothetical protein